MFPSKHFIRILGYRAHTQKNAAWKRQDAHKNLCAQLMWIHVYAIRRRVHKLQLETLSPNKSLDMQQKIDVIG